MERSEWCDYKIEGEWGSIHKPCDFKKDKTGTCSGGCLKSEIEGGKIKLANGTGPDYEVIRGYCLRERINKRMARKAS